MRFFGNILAVFFLGFLAALALEQQRTIDDLSNKATEYEERLADVELALAKKEDLSGLFYKFIVLNHKSIQSLQRKLTVTVTAYSARPEETDDTPNHTASNERVRPGTVAVSRDLFDSGWVFGKKIYIKGLGVFTISDLMAQRKRNHIDIFIGDTDEARSFGVQTLEAHLIDI
ncbi:MAG: 3D domain-containing protein [Thermodesulfobacteriota bacterium]